MKYKTKPTDYTGCDHVIAEHLKRGEMIYCNVSDNCKTQSTCWIDGFMYGKYLSEDITWINATPIPQTTTYVKKASEIVKWLEDNGWRLVQTTRDMYWCDKIDQKFLVDMFLYCGKENINGYNWLPEWLEER